MSKRKRTILAIIFIELMFAAGWFYLASLAQTPESARRIGEAMGLVMGILLGLSPLLYLIARRNDLKDAERQAARQQ
jgi:hypothetical protein